VLNKLYINNYALIDEIEIEPQNGLNTITGETGAGKSIIMDALELLLGERADIKILKDSSKKCVIEAVFDISGYTLESFFEEQDIEFDRQTILRREISAQGKSRAFINDSPVNLTQLRELGKLLVDIHSQHETMLVNKTFNRFEIIDACLPENNLIKEYQNAFKELKKTTATLNDLLEQDKKAKLDYDYIMFQHNEIEAVNIKPGELNELEEEQKTLSHAEEIKSSLVNCTLLLQHTEKNVLELLKDIQVNLDKAAKYNKSIEELSNRVESCRLELKDISSEIESAEESIQFNPEKLEELNNRISIINNLLYKHRLKNEEELLSLKNELLQKINNTDTLSEAIEKLEKQKTAIENKCILVAKNIAAARKKIIPDFEREIKEILTQLSMPYAQFKIELEESQELNAYGCNNIKFLFNANKGGKAEELQQIASGGEYSRLMLAIKSIVCKNKKLPTIIFDEIDTGVSGEVADKMGKIMKQMSAYMQVIAITHLPQVAVKGNNHYKVYKVTTGQHTASKIKLLNEKERIEEIAKMLSGEKLSAAALENAKALMQA
jgi:DNA repair protein RecN (Recombination protein N)